MSDQTKPETNGTPKPEETKTPEAPKGWNIFKEGWTAVFNPRAFYAYRTQWDEYYAATQPNRMTVQSLLKGLGKLGLTVAAAVGIGSTVKGFIGNNNSENDQTLISNETSNNDVNMDL